MCHFLFFYSRLSSICGEDDDAHKHKYTHDTVISHKHISQESYFIGGDILTLVFSQQISLHEYFCQIVYRLAQVTCKKTRYFSHKRLFISQWVF